LPCVAVTTWCRSRQGRRRFGWDAPFGPALRPSSPGRPHDGAERKRRRPSGSAPAKQAARPFALPELPCADAASCSVQRTRHWAVRVKYRSLTSVRAAPLPRPTAPRRSPRKKNPGGCVP
jgi:hypothetical protein